jgi:hypothetical protein
MGYHNKLPVVAALVFIAWTGAEVHGEMIRSYSYIYGSDDVAPSVPIPWAQPGNVGIFDDGVAAQNVTFSHLALANRMFSAGNGDNPLIFHNATLRTEFFVSDPATGNRAEGVVFFPAVINGTLDPVSFRSNLTLSFLGPKTQSFVLDGNRYTATIGTFHPFTWKSFGGGPGAGEFRASIDAQVDVSPAAAAATPEPSCLALVGMGLLTAAGAAWRKRSPRPSARAVNS